MAIETDPKAKTRVPLTKERVFEAAVELADREGIEALTMRGLAAELGVEAMSLYYHVANKEAVLDGVVEAIMAEIGQELGGFEIPEQIDDWQEVAKHRILACREVMLRHKWAPSVFESRTNMAMGVILYFEGLLGVMKEGGLSYDLAHHGLHALGSRALGFSQELFSPDDQETTEETEEMFEHLMDHLPYMAGMLSEIAHEGPDTTIGWCDDQTEFIFALDVLLNGLEARRLAEAG